MILTQTQADMLLRIVNLEESMDSDYALFLLDIGEAFSELKTEYAGTLALVAEALAKAKLREEKNKKHWMMINEGIDRRKSKNAIREAQGKDEVK